jgi:hypothetical protein
MKLWVNRDIKCNLCKTIWLTVVGVCSFTNHLDVTRRRTLNYTCEKQSKYFVAGQQCKVLHFFVHLSVLLPWRAISITYFCVCVCVRARARGWGHACMCVLPRVCVCVGVGRKAGAQECACALVGLLIHYATHRRHIIGVLSGSIIFSTIFRKKSPTIKCVFWFSTQRLIESFLILRRIQRDIVIMLERLHVKYPLFLSDFNGTGIFSRDFRKSQKY